MTTKTQSRKNITPKTLLELLGWAKSFFETEGYHEGRHYQSLHVDESNSRLNLKANTTALREEMQTLIQKYIRVQTPTGVANTKSLWIFPTSPGGNNKPKRRGGGKIAELSKEEKERLGVLTDLVVKKAKDLKVRGVLTKRLNSRKKAVVLQFTNPADIKNAHSKLAIF